MEYCKLTNPCGLFAGTGKILGGKMTILAVLGHLCFIVTYGFYIKQFLDSNAGGLIYPIYLLPAAAYSFLFMFSFMAGKIPEGSW